MHVFMQIYVYIIIYLHVICICPIFIYKSAVFCFGFCFVFPDTCKLWISTVSYYNKWKFYNKNLCKSQK